MGTELAALGVYPKANKGDKVYYVNRKRYRFPIPKLDEKGKKIYKTNPHTGEQLRNSRGEPEYLEEGISFVPWHGRFTTLGYWSIKVVTKDTPKEISALLAERAKAANSEIMDEEAFIKMTNPAMLETIKVNTELEKENEALKAEKSKADELIASLKKKAGIE